MRRDLYASDHQIPIIYNSKQGDWGEIIMWLLNLYSKMFSLFLELEIYVRYINLKKRWMPYNKYMKWEDYHYIINYERFNDDNISYLPVNFFWELEFMSWVSGNIKSESPISLAKRFERGRPYFSVSLVGNNFFYLFSCTK